MSQKVVLDPSRENSIRAGFAIIETEVDFLRQDGKEGRLWIRGAHLCRWVSDLYRVRGLKEGPDYQVLASPRNRLRNLVGGNADELHLEIVARAVEYLDEIPTITLGELLAHLTKDEIWTELLSREHAARWLLTEFEENLIPLVEAQRHRWVQHCTSEKLETVKALYGIPLNERSHHLKLWLCINEDTTGLGVFPIQVKGKAATLLKDEWGRLLRETRGVIIEKLSPANPNAKQIAAAAYDYFFSHVEFITPSILARIAPMLDVPQRTRLEGRMPRQRPQPLSINSTVEVALDWVTKEYLPYRQWQVLAASDEETAVEYLADSFTDWILNNYPGLTTYTREQSYLNVRGRYIIDKLVNERPVFWVVADGLNHVNHKRLLWFLAQTEGALGIEQDLALFAILPTVTKKAKYGLTSGLFPRENTKGEWSTKKVFSSTFPGGVYAGKAQLDRLRTGLSDPNVHLLYWNMTAVDECYHEQRDPDAILRNVEAQLKALAENISDLVMGSPNRDRIAIVISTDHGQMLGPCIKSKPCQENIQTHGRTAYGKLLNSEIDANEPFNKSSDSSLVFLNSIRFQLDEPTTLALGRYYFGGWTTDTQGRAWGVHGGLYPEEVVIGFSILSRKPERKPIVSTISGTGEVGKLGIMMLKIDNPNPAPFSAMILMLNEIEEFRQGNTLSESIHAIATETIEIAVNKFPAPTTGDSLIVNGTLWYEFEDGVQHECKVSGTLICKQMYSDQRPSLRDKFKR